MITWTITELGVWYVSCVIVFDELKG